MNQIQTEAKRISRKLMTAIIFKILPKKLLSHHFILLIFCNLQSEIQPETRDIKNRRANNRFNHFESYCGDRDRKKE